MDFRKFIADLAASFKKLAGPAASPSSPAPGRPDVDTNATREAGHQAGYDAGYDQGFEDGREAGHALGYKEGYNEGLLVGMEEASPAPEPQQSADN